MENFTSLALDGSGLAHISFFDVGSGMIRYAADTSGAWDVDDIEDAGTEAECHSAIAIDDAGRIHIAFYNSNLGALRYAVQSE